MAELFLRTPRAHAIAAAVVLLLSADPTSAYNVFGIGAQQANPWTAAVSAEPGEYLLAGRNGLGTSTAPVLTSSSFVTWRETLAVSIDSIGGPWLRPFFLPDTLNLAQDGVRDRIGHGIFNNIVVSGGNNIVSAVVVIRPMFDGDPKTATLFGVGQSPYIQFSMIDLGADFPINRVRFFPRLGRDNPDLDRVLAEMSPPQLTPEELGEQDFSVNALPWFEVSAAASAVGFPSHPTTASRQRPWHQAIRRTNPEPDPRLSVLSRETENLDAVVEIRFPTRSLQWVGFRPLDPDALWEMAEFQVFGKGHVPRSVYTTAVLDFGEPMAWGRIRWRGERDPEARILIRTRTGVDADPNRYWIPTSVPGVDREISRQEYEREDIRRRYTTLDEDHWSFWSAPYAWEEGLRDTSLAAETWSDGTRIRAAGPARYLQLQILFESTLSQTTRLQDLEIQFDRPAAARVVAEIWPVEVPRTEASGFTYSLRPSLAAGQGFDRLEIFTLTRVEAVHAVRVDGVEIGDPEAVRILDDRLIISLPRLTGPEDSFKLVEVDFDIRVVRYGTVFDSWIFDSLGGGVRQRVVAGDATVEYPGNDLGVRTDDLGGSLLASVQATPNPFTPNGDGINDVTFLHFGVHEVSAPRALTVDIYDLGARRVRRLEERDVVRGLSGDGIPMPVWDGRDDAGRRVSPGIYVYRIELDADASKQSATGSISVVY